MVAERWEKGHNVSFDEVSKVLANLQQPEW